LVPSKEFESPPDWRFSHIECSPAPEKVDHSSIQPKLEKLQKEMVPKEILEEKDPAKQMELSQKWGETEDSKKFRAAVEEILVDLRAAEERNRAKQIQRRVCAVNKDGTFRLDDIPEGDWQLKVQLDSPPPTGEGCGMGERLGKLEYNFTVAAVSGGVSDEPLDLGTLEVQQLAQQNPFLRVGDVAPEFEIVRIEPLTDDAEYEDKGAKLRLSDYKGKYAVLDFWAMWCGPCLAEVPELKTLYEKIKDDDRFVMIGISLDNAGSEEMLGKFIARREMPWLHGLSGDWNSDTARSYGIQSIPALLLIGTDGKVLLSNPDLATLAKMIDELKGK
jgi:thiol-disulfide isomerase/thioredoxin